MCVRMVCCGCWCDNGGLGSCGCGCIFGVFGGYMCCVWWCCCWLRGIV